MKITPHEHDFGAAIEGVDLSTSLSVDATTQIRQAWLQHKVVYFPNQIMSYEQLEAFSLAIGPFGDDPYVLAIDGH